jgi:hypothetical protein
MRNLFSVGRLSQRAVAALSVIEFILALSSGAGVLAGSSPGRTRVFLLAGQSNMNGQGTNSELTSPYDSAQTNVAFWHDGAWEDLSPGFGNTSEQFGPEVTFGYTVRQALPSDRIFLIKYAVNGTALYNDWAPSSGPQYSAFMSTALAALADLDAAGVDYEISAMLWLQGESDALEGHGEAYETNLRNFIDDMRTRFDAPDLPFYIARVREHYGTPEQTALVRTAQVVIADSTANVEWFDTDSYNPLINGGHYDTAGQVGIGIDFANTFLAGEDPVSVADAAVTAGLSPYNWVCQSQFVGSAICGASLKAGFRNTQQVSLEVNSDHMATSVTSRFPIISWSVNGGPAQTHQLKPDEQSVVLASGVQDPVIDLYLKGFSPFENRYSGDAPVNSIKITGFAVDRGGAAASVSMPEKIWLNIGDSIMSGDAAAYAEGQGRPANDLWAASDDGRASYGWLLAAHYGFREARLAYGGYNWAGGMAGIPALTTLIDQKTSTLSRLQDGFLSPSPDVVLINLGENGIPDEIDVAITLMKIRCRVDAAATLIVMIPVSGNGETEITGAFDAYVANTGDANAHLVNLGEIEFATAEGQHPTAAGHLSIFEAALPAFETIIDTDGDGMVDLTDSDDDNDGMSDADEAIAGTDSKDIKSLFLISDAGADGGLFSVQFDSVADRLYDIYSKDGLAGSNSWQLLTNNLAGTGEALAWQDSASDLQCFYRVEVKQK